MSGSTATGDGLVPGRHVRPAVPLEGNAEAPGWNFTGGPTWTPAFGECVDFGDAWRQSVSGPWGSWYAPCIPPTDPSTWAADQRAFALHLFREAPIPLVTVNVNPRPGLVQIPNWFWLAGGLTATMVVSGEIEIPPEVGPEVPTERDPNAFGRPWVPADSPRRLPTTRTVEVAVWPAGYVWEFGDGAPPLYTASRGQAYPQASEVAHVYRFASFYTGGGFPVVVQAVYEAAFRVDGGAWESLGARATRPEVFRHPVQEIQTVLSVRPR